MADALIRVVVHSDEAEAGIERLSRAFARLEQREPSMVLRRAHLALVDLGASALGAQGRIGQLVVSLAGLAGPMGWAAVGVVGALGLAFRELSKEGDDAAKNVEAAANRMHTAIAGAVKEGFGPERRAVFASSIATAQAQLAALQASAVPAGVTRSTYTPYGYSTSVDTSAAEARNQKIDDLKTLVGQLTVGLAELDKESEKAAQAGLRSLREELSGINAEIQTFVMGSAARGMAPLNLAGIKVPNLAQLQFAETARQVNLAGANQAVNAIGFSLMGVAQGHAAGDTGRQTASTTKDWERIGSALLTGMTMLASSRGGSTGAAALGALGETASAASGLKMFAGDAKWLGPAGFALSAASSLVSLFSGGGHKPKVIISAFEEDAARQIKELRSEPATTQYIIIGPADMRQTQQQLARLGRMGVISRLPR